MLPNDVHHVYHVIDKDGAKQYYPAGRFLVNDGSIAHLEDYHGHLAEHIPEGAIDDYTMSKLGQHIDNVAHSSHTALRGGHHHHLIPMAQLDPLPVQAPAPAAQDHIEVKPPSVWHYHRSGHDQPHTLEAREGKFMLDGNPLEHHEVATILDNVRTKAAKIRYANGVMAQKQAQTIAKMERVFKTLRKNDVSDAEGALHHLEGLGLDDDRTKTAIASLRRQVFDDQMVPGLGNKYAYKKFAERNVPGTTVVGDANFFKNINDTHGHEAGDAAIKAMGSAWRDASNEVGGKAHRFGGDEFHAHFPTYEHAANFARNLRSKLDQVPPINGTNKLSMSLGIGHDFPTADKAVYHAKQGKGMHTPSTVPSVLAHSLHQEFPGSVPLNHEHLQIHAPEIEQRPVAPTPSAPTQSPSHAA
jgi:diguanylate cyclase (GGDEF)-like protein